MESSRGRGPGNDRLAGRAVVSRAAGGVWRSRAPGRQRSDLMDSRPRHNRRCGRFQDQLSTNDQGDQLVRGADGSRQRVDPGEKARIDMAQLVRKLS